MRSKGPREKFQERQFRLGTMLLRASLSVLILRHLLPTVREIREDHRLGYNVYQGALWGRALPSGWRMTLVDMRSVPSARHIADGTSCGRRVVARIEIGGSWSWCRASHVRPGSTLQLRHIAAPRRWHRPREHLLARMPSFPSKHA